MNDTPLVTIEQHLLLRLTPADAGALLGALDRPLLNGTAVARIYDALAEATGYGQRSTRIKPLEQLRPVSTPPPGMVGDERGFSRFLEQNTPRSPVLDDSLLPRASAGQFIDDPLT